MVSNIQKWMENLKRTNPLAYTEHQRKAGIIGGKTPKFETSNMGQFIRTEKHREISRKNMKKLILKYPNMNYENGKKVHIMYPTMSSDTAKKTHKKYPDLAYRMGHSTQIKHPNQSSIFMNQTNKRLMQENPEKYRLQRSSTMIKFHKEHPEYAKNSMTNLNKKYPNMAREASLKAVEIQSQIGFISKPEQIIKQLLPDDFLHGKRLGNSVPDFHSIERKIVVEVDGEYWHSKLNAQKRDINHNEMWQRMGYKVFRIPSKDVIQYFKPLLRSNQ